jgi:hypothetical protein
MPPEGPDTVPGRAESRGVRLAGWCERQGNLLASDMPAKIKLFCQFGGTIP